MSSSNSGGTLRPAWNRGNSKGFHPPPQVEQPRASSKGHRNDTAEDKQNANQQSSQRDNYNKFSALDIDDDDVALATTTSGASSSLHNNATNDGTVKISKSSETKPTNLRSEGLRSGTGRSLADLAARAPERTNSRFSNLRTTGGSTDSATIDNKSTTVPPSTSVTEENVVRYTRERILSLRPPPLPEPNALLKEELEGTAILSDKAQDPVCWDNLDAEKIWSTVPTRRNIKEDAIAHNPGIRRAPSITASGATPSVRRDSSIRDGGVGGGGGRWQRGVALPPEGSALNIVGKPHRSARDSGGNHHHHHKDAENPNDLWDDPAASGDGALMDFSAFGDTGNDNFDFDKMADASKKLEEELHGTRSRASSNATNDEEVIPLKSVNPNRPLATAGTTIRSGSGDHVNVFEDFDDPGNGAEDVSGNTKIAEDANVVASDVSSTPTIKAANEDPSASSRLMAMIGVKRDDKVVSDASLTAWGQTTAGSATISMPAVSLNPWGDPILPPSVLPSSVPAPNGVTTTTEMQQHGLDLQARLRHAELEKQKVEENRRLEEELQRQRQQQEQERAHSLQQQQQQQAGVQSQVELVLMERISTILENSWGRSDLGAILSTLHTEDPRVAPLLNNVDSLRALLLRNPRRVALRQDPSLRIETAALLITNAQWNSQQQQQEVMQQQQKQQQQQQAIQLQQQEELQRLERQRRLEEQHAAVARSQLQSQQIIPDAPWFYSDPSKNIQGPFRGEEMRQWLEAGYFKGDLPISQNPTGPFRPLAIIFTDLSVAFMNPKSGASQSQTAVFERSKLEEQGRREQAERARIEAEAAEREFRRAKEQQRKESEAAAAAVVEEQRRQQAATKGFAKAEKGKTANGENDSSNQLKLMLGLGSTLEMQSQNNKTTETKVTIQEVQRQQAEEAKKHPEPISAKNAPPAWGGVAVAQPVAKKSMSEIQKEEAKAAAVAAMNRQSVKPSSSGWANVAAAKGGSTAWSGGAVKPQVVAAVVTTPAPATTIQRAVPNRSVSTTTASTTTGSTSSVPQGQLQRASSVSSRDTGSANAFGAKMEPALEKWCKDQMYKLNGTDDLTLIDFCMILTDSEEIRQYLTAYLGSTQQVNAFATEFIQRKGGNQKKNVEEWESTATGKKGKKKKIGA